MAFSDDIQIFLDYCEGKGLSAHTCRAYKGDLNNFADWLASRADHDLSEEMLDEWLKEMRSRHYAPATIKRKFASLKVALRWLDDKQLLATNPFHGYRTTIRQPRKLPKALGKAEVKALLQCASSITKSDGDIRQRTIRLAVELLFATGIRVGELCSIKLRDIDLASGTMTVNGKGSRERQVFIVDDNVLSLLGGYIESHGTWTTGTRVLLLTNRGTAATPDFIRRNLHELARKAGINKRITCPSREKR